MLNLRPARAYVATDNPSKASEVAALLNARGFLTTASTDRPGYSGARSVAELLDTAREDVAALTIADVVVTLPGETDHTDVYTAESYAVPTIKLAELLAPIVADAVAALALLAPIRTADARSALHCWARYRQLTPAQAEAAVSFAIRGARVEVAA